MNANVCIKELFNGCLFVFLRIGSINLKENNVNDTIRNRNICFVYAFLY